MNHAMIEKQALRFSRARTAMISIFVITMINFVLIALDANFSFVYSAFFPQLIFVVIAYDFGLFGLGLILGIGAAAVYLLCWILSNRWRAFVLVAMILFSLDTLFRLLLILGTGDTAGILLDVAICALVLFYLIGGTVAWAKLRRLTPHDFQAVQEDLVQAAHAEEVQSALDAIAPEQDALPREEAPAEAPYTETQQAASAYEIDPYTKSSLIALVRASNKVETLYMFEDIPPKKLKNAREKYASSMGPDETVILLYDDTVTGSAKEGFLLTGKRLYSKNFGIQGDAVHLLNINRLTTNFGKVSTHIMVEMDTRGEMEIHVTKSQDQAEAVYNILDRVLSFLKTQARRI